MQFKIIHEQINVYFLLDVKKVKIIYCQINPQSEYSFAKLYINAFTEKVGD